MSPHHPPREQVDSFDGDGGQRKLFEYASTAYKVLAKGASLTVHALYQLQESARLAPLLPKLGNPARLILCQRL